MFSSTHAALARLIACLLFALPSSTLVAQDALSVSAAAGWRQNTWAGGGDMMRRGAGAETVFHIASLGGGDIGWSTTIPVEPGEIYRIAGSIRTEDLQRGSGRGALISVQDVANGQTEAVTGTSPWTEVSTIFRSGDRREITAICLFGGWGQSTGQAWYRNIRLEKIDLSADFFMMASAVSPVVSVMRIPYFLNVLAAISLSTSLIWASVSWHTAFVDEAIKVLTLVINSMESK